MPAPWRRCSTPRASTAWKLQQDLETAPPGPPRPPTRSRTLGGSPCLALAGSPCQRRRPAGSTCGWAGAGADEKPSLALDPRP
eukprot:9468487-Pyramimonas_sp.AAC.4